MLKEIHRDISIRPATAVVEQDPARKDPAAGGGEGAVVVWEAADPKGRLAWQEAWKESGEGEVFSHPAFVSAVAAPGERPHCAYLRTTDGQSILYAFILRPITQDAEGRAVEDDLWDIYTPLVYGGPIGHGVSQKALDTFWVGLHSWARRHGVVSEIIRFTPVDRHRLPYPGTLREQAPHIVVELEELSEDEVIARLRKSTRRAYRKGLESGLSARLETTDRGIEDFLAIHTETMDRVDAHSSFYLEEGFLRTLHRCLPGRLAYVFALQDDRPVSVELILFRDGTSYAYLGGTRTDALKNGSTTVASVAAIQEAHRRGMREHVLTGGVTNTSDDPLLTFKRGFTRDGDRRYFTGEQVFLPEAYEQLCSEAPGSNLPPSDFFPYYRAFARSTE